METEDYRLTKWKGLDNWQCKHCPFATVGGLGAMLAHLSIHVPPKPESSPSAVVIAAAGGKVLGRADEVFPAGEPDEEE